MGLISRVSSRTYRGKCLTLPFRSVSPLQCSTAAETRSGSTQMNRSQSATPTADTTSDDTSRTVLSSKSKSPSTVEPEPTSPPDDSVDTLAPVNDSVPPTPEPQSRTC